MPNTPLVLVDSYAQIYRAYHAVRGLTAPDGTPVNALFALARFLLKLQADRPGGCGAFVFDKGKPPHRMALAPDYKANRPPMPDDLRVQIPLIKELVSFFGWPEIEYEGCEADDLIASLTAAFPQEDFEIYSADKDLAQIISERVWMMIPEHAGGFSKRGTAEVVGKFGVNPEQIADYLALIGDTADNIPGVDGVGPKTAAQLLQQFGNGDAIFESLDQVGRESLRKKLTDSRYVFRKNQKLVKLQLDPPNGVVWNLGNLQRREPDWAAIGAFCRKYGLRSILRDLPSAPAADTEADDLFSLPPAPEKTTAPARKIPGEYEQMSLF